MAHRTISLRTGRILGLSGAGNAEANRLAVMLHPTPGASGFDPDPAVSDASDVHMLSVDRPGYGASEPLPEAEAPTISGHADDVAEFLRRSELSAHASSGVSYGSVGVVGFGAGGRYALSFAARHPGLVERVVIVGLPSPENTREDPDSTVVLDALRVADDASVTDVVSKLQSIDQQSFRTLGLSEDDPALRTTLALDRRIGRMVGDAYLQGVIGVATDLVAKRDTSWIDGLGDVRAKTLLLYGAEDLVAGEADARWFAERIPDAEIAIIPGVGGAVIGSEWQRVLDFISADNEDQESDDSKGSPRSTAETH